MGATLPDTSILIAALCDWHEHYDVAAPALTSDLRSRAVVVAGPVLTEAYAALTRMPPPHRLSPADSRAVLRENLAGLRMVSLDSRGYWQLVDDSASRQIAGGRVRCGRRGMRAARTGERILTLNRRDFEALVPPELVIDCPLAEG